MVRSIGTVTLTPSQSLPLILGEGRGPCDYFVFVTSSHISGCMIFQVTGRVITTNKIF